MISVEQLKQSLLARRPMPKARYLSSGSTLLNLATSGLTKGCFRAGHYYIFIGDSTSGKTFLALTCLAEAKNSKNFRDYRIIYDNAEDGALMDMEKFFGSRVADSIESPSTENGDPVFSHTIEEFYYHLDDAVKEGRPFIYVLDSMDALSSKYEREKFQDTKKATRRGKETTGSMGDGKAKINSAGVRQALADIQKTGSILIIISQTRDAMNVGPFAGFGETRTRAGGRALKFYATLEIWSSVATSIKRVVKGKKRKLGIISKCQVKKNRETGKDRTVEIPIYWSVGIDDLGSCVEYLIDEGRWKGTEANVKAKDFDWDGSKEGLIEKIQSEGLEEELIAIVGETWREIESACELKRKPRYE